MLRDLVATARSWRSNLQLPEPAKAERQRDHSQPLPADPGIDPTVRAALDWLGAAQDRSASADGGAARHYSLVQGWGPSYPETTGYIVPTLLAAGERLGDAAVAARGRRMLDWLVSIQREDGGFQGGMIGQTPVVSVTFNTGQILMGLADGVARFGDAYRPAMERAADWLVATQDADGAWRRAPTPFAEPGEKVYETHVAWGLLEAARQAPERGYGEAGLRNVRWALGHQQANGWFAQCCLTDATQPLTHTIGYVLRGVVEAYRFSGDATFLAAARRTADGLLGALEAEGRLPGRLDADWRGTVPWVCLTGSVQIAHCWLLLYLYTGDARYRDAAYAANAFVRRTVRLDGPPETRGGVKGSYPVDGWYGAYQYLNWAAKFFVDANFLEADVRAGRLAPAAAGGRPA